MIMIIIMIITCQVIGWKDSSDDTFMWWGDYLHKAQVEEIVWMFGLLMLLSVFSRPYTIYTVSQKNQCDYVFDDNLNSKRPIVIIFGTVIT